MSRQTSSFSRRSFVAAAAATGALVALGGCGKKAEDKPAGNATASSSQPQATAQGKIQEGGTFKWYINNPTAIDPMYAQESFGIAVTKQLFDTLTEFDPRKKKVIPFACESFEASPDAMTFTFHLRKGAKFHNGDPVTSQNFKYGWERLCSPSLGTQGPSTVSYHISDVVGYQDVIDGKTTELKGLECPDEFTFVVHLSKPFADFPYITTHPVTSAVPTNLGGMKPLDFGLAPIGNGPFKMKGKWEDGQVIQTVRNDDYYGNKMHIDGIEYRILIDQQTGFREFEAGNLDLTQIPAGQAPELLKKYGRGEEDGYVLEPNHQMIIGTRASTYYFAFNNEDPILKNPDVRRGLSLAVNRQGICDTVYKGLAVPADDIVPPSIDGYEKGAWKYATYDVEKAKEFLKKAGYDGSNKLSLNLLVNEDLDQKQVAQLIKADLEKVGVDLTIETLENAAQRAKLVAGEYQLCRVRWGADYPIADNFLFPLLKSGNGDNYARYNNPAYDEKILAARSIVDAKERVDAMKECAKMAGEDCPMMLISFPTLDWVGSNRVHGVLADSLNYWHFQDCWIEKDKQAK